MAGAAPPAGPVDPATAAHARGSSYLRRMSSRKMMKRVGVCDPIREHSAKARRMDSFTVSRGRLGVNPHYKAAVRARARRTLPALDPNRVSFSNTDFPPLSALDASWDASWRCPSLSPIRSRKYGLRRGRGATNLPALVRKRSNNDIVCAEFNDTESSANRDNLSSMEDNRLRLQPLTLHARAHKAPAQPSPAAPHALHPELGHGYSLHPRPGTRNGTRTEHQVERFSWGASDLLDDFDTTTDSDLEGSGEIQVVPW
jgi:hypothetical protein